MTLFQTAIAKLEMGCHSYLHSLRYVGGPVEAGAGFPHSLEAAACCGESREAAAPSMATQSW